MTHPKPGNPLLWGFWAAAGIAALQLVSFLIIPPEHRSLKPYSEIVAFAWGYGLCIVADNLRHWLWSRAKVR